jgi:hypothetical protein
MRVSAEKLETAILAILRGFPECKHEANMRGQFGWIDLVTKYLGESADYYAEIEAALIRLDSRESVLLTQCNPECTTRYKYKDAVVADEVFFGRNFEAALTAEGRGIDVPRSSNMGFKRSA